VANRHPAGGQWKRIVRQKTKSAETTIAGTKAGIVPWIAGRSFDVVSTLFLLFVPFRAKEAGN
jgi:hypothetical protein